MANLKTESDRRAFWRAVVQRFGRSGLCVREFCRAEGVSEPSFYQWRRKFQRRDSQGAPRPPAFVPLVAEPPGEPTATAPVGVEVVLRSGHVLRVLGRLDRAGLADLVAALEGRPC
jgi:transposase-like protein